MEMGIAVAALIISAIALAFVAVMVVLLLMMSVPDEEDAVAEVDTVHPTTEDVEKRRRQAVQAAHHRNFMDYDGSPQKPVDPNTILADGG